MPASTTSGRAAIAPTPAARGPACSTRPQTTTPTMTTWIWIPTTSAAMAATATPLDPPAINQQSGRRRRSPAAVLFQTQISDHDDPGADIDAAVEVDDVFIAHPDATGRHVGADCP